MTAFALKIIASICMSIDHIGAVFPFYTPEIFRWIGRIAFPIYAYLIAEGCTYTKNINKYMLRLGMFALISEIPFDLAFGQIYFSFEESPLEVISFISFTNVFYTLFLSVACISIYEKLKLKSNQLFALIPLILVPSVLLFAAHPYAYSIARLIIGFYTLCIIILSNVLPNAKTNSEIKLMHNILALIPALPLILLGNLLSTDYGMFGIVFILILYLAKTKRNRLIVLFFGVLYKYGFGLLMEASYRNIPNAMCLVFALLSAVVIFFYNEKRGRRLKWAFYWFYPAHIALLAFISIFFVKSVFNGF